MLHPARASHKNKQTIPQSEEILVRLLIIRSLSPSEILRISQFSQAAVTMQAGIEEDRTPCRKEKP
jgi:hypothetical protein